MKDILHSGMRMKEERKRGWLRRLAITLGPPLVLLIYFLLLERYGFLLFDFDSDERDEPVIEAAP